MTPNCTLALTVNTQHFALHICPLQWGLFNRDAFIFGMKKDSKGHDPHWHVATQLGYKTRELLIKHWGHI
jgi:hypothetical protein